MMKSYPEAFSDDFTLTTVMKFNNSFEMNTIPFYNRYSIYFNTYKNNTKNWQSL